MKKYSLTELREFISTKRSWIHHESEIKEAMPVLLDAVSAAVEFALTQETREPGEFAQDKFDVMWTALDKVCS